MTRLHPTDPMPDLNLGLAGGGRWRLADNAPGKLLMIDVYRGHHCPRCRRHLEALAIALPDFAALGVDVIAVSTDPADKADRTRAEWALPGLALGHGLPVDTARTLGCYISTSLKPEEHDVFAEPGVFFVKPDLTLYGAVIGSFPFARPSVADLLEVATIVTTRDYPARGTRKA